jgi:hypothetical protein
LLSAPPHHPAPVLARLDQVVLPQHRAQQCDVEKLAQPGPGVPGEDRGQQVPPVAAELIG